MATFYLVDQSLKGVGGHHYDYSSLICNAVNCDAANGNTTDSSPDIHHWKVVVGSHKKFKDPDTFANCEVRNLFRYTTYASCSQMIGIKDMVAKRQRTGLWRRIFQRFGFSKETQSIEERQRQRRVQVFREDCHRFFREKLTPEDIVFFTTLSDLEAEGLYLFLQDRADARQANWHLQFHFPLFRGRTPAYQHQQENLTTIKPVFQKLRSLEQTQIRFYVTSETLKDQYEQLGYSFESLPYPVNPQLCCSPGRPAANERIRIAFAGAIRQEKGAAQIQSAIDEIEQRFGPQVRFALQKKKAKWTSRVRSFFSRSSRESADRESPHTDFFQYPLSAADYQQFIKSSDIGLLTTYDSETYFSRRAGILGEYLAAGVPVIVPAGCWLSDQIEAEQQKYLAELVLSDQIKACRLHPENTSHTSDHKTVVQFNVGERKESESDHYLLVLNFDVQKPSQHGYYFEVKSKTGGSSESSSIQIVGQPRDQATRRVAIEVADGDANIEIEIRPAFGGSQWQVENISAELVSSDQLLPRSRVGLVAASAAQTAALTGEMLKQYQHYRRSAAEYSPEWFKRHDPKLTFRTLINHSHLIQQQKAEAA